MREMRGKITGVLTRAAADFPNGCRPAKSRSDNLQNGRMKFLVYQQFQAIPRKRGIYRKLS